MAQAGIPPEQRRVFDEVLDEVLGELPEEITALLEEVPLVVDDRPTRELLAQLGVDRPEWLRGLYTGVPLTRRSVHDTGRMPDVIRVFRLGILTSAHGRGRRLDRRRLRRQVRTTLLHEIGHHFGMDEAYLRRLGYG